VALKWQGWASVKIQDVTVQLWPMQDRQIRTPVWLGKPT